MSFCRGSLARTGEAKIVLTGHDSLVRHSALAVAFTVPNSRIALVRKSSIGVLVERGFVVG